MNVDSNTAGPKLSYKMRPIYSLAQSPLFTMFDRSVNFNSKSSACVSLPMYAKYANKTMNDV